MLSVHNSNRLEFLFSDLSDILAVPLANPLAPEIVLVQSQGMARWLSLQTAAKRGIAANLDCSFPATFIWRLLRLNAIGTGDPYERDALVWTVFSLLESHLDQDEFSPVKRYLSGSQPFLKLYQLSHKIACLFDQYMVFRPEWILEWSTGAGEGWQPVLWRSVQEKCGGQNRAEMLKAFLESIDDTFVRQLKLPERLSLFGIPALPPSMFAVFAKLAEYVEVHIFLLQPCREYWADLASKDELSRIDLRSGQSSDPSDDLHFEGGNSLLLNMGKMGRDFQHVLHSFDYQEFHNFSEPEKNPLLIALQSDILNGIEPEDSNVAGLAIDDQSVQIHAVHSPMREVEVLYQNLLSLFQEKGELNPADLLVMVPDINLYTPFIEAVFSTPEQENQTIPFSIADKGASGQHVKGFLSLLALLGSRMTSSLVFDFLSQEKVRNRFDIQEGEMETIRTWIEKSAICWGIDGQHHEELGLPHEKNGTWEAGLDRLLLGYALPEPDSLFLDILPCDQIEGGSAQLLAKFLDFFTKLTAVSRKAAKQKDPVAWAAFLRKLLDDFFEDSGPSSGTAQREKRTILNAIDTFVRQSETAQFNQEISFEIVQIILQKEFDASLVHTEFLGGSVTFCQMVPMRSIPFQVICLLGMNDAAFPRQDRPVGFDLMLGNFRVGDRCRRDDDRYIFLETLLSARKLLYISYIGVGVQSGEIFPPSVVVSELLAAIGPYLGGNEKEAARRFTTVHPLQPFSERYFLGDSRLNNFSELYRQTARTIKNDTPYAGLFEKRLEKIEKIELSITDFLAFFEHPCRYLLQKRLGLNLDDRHSDLEDRELFSLDNLERYKLLSQLLDSRLLGDEKDPDHDALKLQEKGVVSFGRIGRYDWAEAGAEVDAFLRPFLPQLAEPQLEPIPVDLDLGVLRIFGNLENLWPSAQFLLRPTSVKKLSYRDSVRFWILHLLLNASGGTPVRTTYFIGKDGQAAYGPIEDALDELNLLARMVVEGMQAPLLILPRATFSFAQKMWNGKTPLVDPEEMYKAFGEAESQWFEGDHFSGPEKDDPYLWAAFGESEPFSWNSQESFSFVNNAEILLRKAFELRTVVNLPL